MKRVDNFIYNIPTSKNGRDGIFAGEMKKEEDINEKFVKKLCEIVCNSLDINYKDQRIFSSLLEKSLESELNNKDDRNPGLLQQLVAKEFEESLKDFKRELKIPNDVRIRHSYASHARLNDISRYISQKFVRVEDIKSDGTFETLWDQNCPSPCDSEMCDEMCETEVCNDVGLAPNNI